MKTVYNLTGKISDCTFTFVLDVHVEVEHDIDMETDSLDVDISDHREEDVIRCLCKEPEDSGLMIQVYLRLGKGWSGVSPTELTSSTIGLGNKD